MNQVRSQVFPGDVDRLRRLGKLLEFIAGLPDHGAHVLVARHGEKHELSDLILQYRGTAAANGTRIWVCPSADAERSLVGGLEPKMVFAAPGFVPRWAIARGGQMEPAERVSSGSAAVSPLGALGPLGHRVEAVERAEVPGALRHAWTASAQEPTTGMRPAWTESQPNNAASRPTRGPWYKPRPQPEVVIKSLRTEACPDRPFRLFAELPTACGAGYTETFATQADADAALPRFALFIREILERHAAHDDTVPLAA